MLGGRYGFGNNDCAMAPVTTQQPAQLSEWADIVERPKAGDEVIVTSDDQPEVVLLSMERYAALRGVEESAIAAEVRAEWDRKLACLNEPGAEEKLRKILDSTPAEIAAAANAARRREKA